MECSLTGEIYKAATVQGLSKAGRPLLVRYNLEELSKSITKDELARRKGGFWRFREFLPVKETKNVISLGEVSTPLMSLPETSKRLGVSTENLLVKDEGRLPTGSFKARGLALAVSMAKELGLHHLAMPTNGNAGAAMAAYASFAGLRTSIFCPDDTPEINISEIELQGASVYRVNGLINDCGKIVGDGKEIAGWFDVSTLKEPYRIEGKKTMGLELAEQFNWELPDVIFYPTGGGTGLIGMWKAFAELEAIGWIGKKRPKMIAVQADGCAPIVKAFQEGEEHAPVWENATTAAAGIRVPVAVGDFLILRAVRESGGFAVSVSEEDIFESRDDAAKRDGVLLCPEGAATLAAYELALKDGLVKKSETAILYNCATGLKYPMPTAIKKINRHDTINYEAMR
tara:strand:+ start:370 stop:1569 length:1200 start_codon:yes stop_codon:yes gene_type:complete